MHHRQKLLEFEKEYERVFDEQATCMEAINTFLGFSVRWEFYLRDKERQGYYKRRKTDRPLKSSTSFIKVLKIPKHKRAYFLTLWQRYMVLEEQWIYFDNHNNVEHWWKNKREDKINKLFE